MNYIKLNPVIRSASIYEKINRKEECVAYDSRVIYMISGDLSATVGKEKFTHLTSGALIYIPAGTPYKLKGKYLMAAVVTFDLTDEMPLPAEKMPPVLPEEYNAELCHNAGLTAPFDKCIMLPEMESESDSFIKMCDIFTSAEGNYLAQISAMLKLILLRVAETTDERALPSRMVENLDEYIREHCGEEISNTEIGAIFGYHPFYVSRVLKDKRGITLRQYIINYRLKAAKRLLELTDKTAVEIADECGFTDASYFAKTFKSAFGMTPKEYRNKFKDDFI